MRTTKITFLILILAAITVAACNKKLKETTETDSTSTTIKRDKDSDRPPTPDEAIMADAMKLVRATCNTQRAKRAYQKEPNNSFKKMKFDNLRKHRNEIGEELKRKYNNDPRTKAMFEDAKARARESLSECEGLERPNVH